MVLIDADALCDRLHPSDFYLQFIVLIKSCITQVATELKHISGIKVALRNWDYV